jgi:hypothetical protein
VPGSHYKRAAATIKDEGRSVVLNAAWPQIATNATPEYPGNVRAVVLYHALTKLAG